MIQLKWPRKSRKLKKIGLIWNRVSWYLTTAAVRIPCHSPQVPKDLTTPGKTHSKTQVAIWSQLCLTSYIVFKSLHESQITLRLKPILRLRWGKEKLLFGIKIKNQRLLISKYRKQSMKCAERCGSIWIGRTPGIHCSYQRANRERTI